MEQEREHIEQADAVDGPVSEDLLSALEVIESQPLAERAAGYAALNDELARRLEQSPRAVDPT